MKIHINEILGKIHNAINESISEENVKTKFEYIFQAHIYKKFDLIWEDSDYILISSIEHDKLYEKIIIKYQEPGNLKEDDKLKKAIKNIQEYLKNLVIERENYNKYLGIIIDGFEIVFIRFKLSFNDWEIVGPNKINKFTIFKLVESIRGLKRKRLSSDLLIKDFGINSNLTNTVINMFYKKLKEPFSEKSNVLFNEWKRLFTRISSYSPEKIKGIKKIYNILDDISQEIIFFIIHSYYALIIKCLAVEIASLFRGTLFYSFLEELELKYSINNEELKKELIKLEDGQIFSKFGIRNFTEGDFYIWYLYEWDDEIAEVIIQIIRRLIGYEPGTIELEPESIRDIFKDLYENLIPQEIRHNLGEYYTPDWVAELILDEIKFNLAFFKKDNINPLNIRILDPTCGSGTFLLNSIIRIKQFATEFFLDKGKSLDHIIKNIVGFDLNPLAVLTSKTIYLLSIADYLRYTNIKIEIPVYLADSLSIEENVFTHSIQMNFDFIIGNPPWLSYRYIGDIKTQERLKRLINQDFNLCNESKLATQMELATLFYIKLSKDFLKKDGTISFVMPRAIVNGDQHHNFRTLKFSGVRIGYYKLIDLKDIQPLFNVASCIIFGKKENKFEFPINGLRIIGRLPRKNINLLTAKKYLKFYKLKIQLYQLGQRSWLDEYDKNIQILIMNMSKKKSYYYKYFYQGASIVPRSMFFINIIKLGSRIDHIVPIVCTSKRAIKMAKSNYKSVKLQGNIESRFLYGVITSTELIPFGFLTPNISILPIMKIDNKYQIITSDRAKSQGYTEFGKWMEEIENIWAEKRGDKVGNYTIYQWINIQNKLINQNPNLRYKIIYPTSAKYLISSIVDTWADKNLEIKIDGYKLKLQGIIIDTTCYFYETNNKDEAYYLCAIMNSNIIDKIIKPMQAQGKWGPRHIHKKVLEIIIPRFSLKNEIHRELSTKGNCIANKVINILPKVLTDYEDKIISRHHIGRIRAKIKEKISNKIYEIDDLIIELFKNISKDYINI